ncbi:MAG TPA: PP2C family protein-serine/threonine phosphatase [Candidatus Elarobacter sp.]|nr:PP2C family protein-serine/threonine phosphatase [Candidatus Elarobacter sp.]
MSITRRAWRAFVGRFLYGTSGWNAVTFALIAGAFGAIIVWVLLAGFRPGGGSLQTHLSVLALSLLVAVAIAAGGLYYGARQATMSRRVDAQTRRADDEHRIAEQLQQAFLQQQLPSLSNLGFSATYLPASHESNVGGDWYDAFELPDGRIMFSMGDVAGHGVDAAVTMSRARQAIITAALQERDPGVVMARANLTLMLQDTKFATAICGYVDPRTLSVTYATAGHPPGILARPGGQVQILQYDGLPLGVAHDATYPTFTVASEDDALLVLYTDGIVEYDRDLAAGERRLLDAVRDVARRRLDNPAAAIERAIFASYEPRDDVAIMTIAFTKESAGNGRASKANRSVGFRGVRAPFSQYGGPTRARPGATVQVGSESSRDG